MVESCDGKAPWLNLRGDRSRDRFVGGLGGLWEPGAPSARSARGAWRRRVSAFGSIGPPRSHTRARALGATGGHGASAPCLPPKAFGPAVAAQKLGGSGERRVTHGRARDSRRLAAVQQAFRTRRASGPFTRQRALAGSRARASPTVARHGGVRALRSVRSSGASRGVGRERRHHESEGAEAGEAP